MRPKPPNQLFHFDAINKRVLIKGIEYQYLGFKIQKRDNLTISTAGFRGDSYRDLLPSSIELIALRKMETNGFCDCDDCRVHVIRPLKKNEAPKIAR